MHYKILFFPVHFLSNIYMRMGQLRQIIYRIIGFTLTNIPLRSCRVSIGLYTPSKNFYVKCNFIRKLMYLISVLRNIM